MSFVESPHAAKVEVFGLEQDGRERWAFAHWYTKHQDSGQAGDLVDGPFGSRAEAERAARARYGDTLGDFAEVPDGVDPLTWADVPEAVRADIERMLRDR